MSKVDTRVALDTYVRQTKPTRNYQDSTVLGLKGWESGDAQYAYVYFNRPFPLGATITSAKMYVHTYAMPEAITHTLSVKRTGARPTLSRLTWDTRPGVVDTPEAVASKIGPLSGKTEWELDITAIMQQVSDGAAWYGVRVTIGENNQQHMYGEETAYGPRLVVEWSDAPDQPANLVPSEALAVSVNKPTLRFDYVDVSGDTELSSVRVQINATDTWSTPAFDSGAVDTSLPELDLSKTAYAGLPADSSPVWWRVSVQDGAGLWSAWSDAVQMRHVDRPTVTITSPTSRFYDATQIVTWTYSGTQTAYQVVLVRTDDPSRTLYNSGKITSSSKAVTIPKGVITRDDVEYRFTVRVWDDVDRASTPGAPTYRQQGINSVFDDDGTKPAVTDLTAKTFEPSPLVELSWTYGSLPDGWLISRGSDLIARLDSEDVPLENGKYVWTDRTARPEQWNNYTVRPVVNGKTVWGNLTVPVKPKPFGIWLLSETEEVAIMGDDDGSFTMGEQSTVHEVLGSTTVAVTTQGLRGYEGSIEGMLVSKVPGIAMTAQEARDKMLEFKVQAAKGTTFRLVVGDMNIPVKIGNVVPRPLPNKEIMFSVSFDFWQDGELEFDAS